jgi:SOUL heme-binding protein
MMKSVLVWILLLPFTALLPGRAIESPQYTVVHSESEFEIRMYHATAWISAPSDKIYFEKATKDGFHIELSNVSNDHKNSFFRELFR